VRPFDPRLLRAAPAARGPVLGLALVGVLQGAATIGVAFALAALAVAVIDGSSLLVPATVLVSLFAARALLAWSAEVSAARAGAEVSAALRNRLVARWLGGRAEDRPDPDTAVTLAAQGCAAVEPYAARFLPALVAASVVPVGAVAALVLVDWPSAVAVMLTLPLLPLFAALIGRTTQVETQRRWRSLAALSGHFLDVVRGLPVLASYGRAERQIETIARVSRSHRLGTMRTLRLAFLSSAALELLATISVAIVAVTVGLRLTTGSLDLHTGLLAILLAPEAYWPIRRVGTEFHAAADGAEAIAAALAQLETPGHPVAADRAGATGAAGDLAQTPMVEVRGLGYVYPGHDLPALEGVDLVADPGLTVISGDSGAGKSTLLELVAGLRTPTSGSVGALRAHLVTQRPFLPAGTVRDAVALGNAAPSGEIWAALRSVGLDGTVAALPRALETRIGDDGFGLSAGQRARLVLARALLSSAPVLLLDEPTAHLDPAAAELVHALIRDVADRRTVVAVTHRTGLLDLADHHLHLSRPSGVRAAVPEEALP
jgi:ATP-binding cassette subfamily C protein CydD